MAVVYIVILISVLVFVHELGHYLAAKIFKVKVLSFSIGFGPKLFGFNKWDTDWEVRALPLGGYVRMLGSDFEDPVSATAEDYLNAYSAKPIWQKAIINFAGPLFNLLLPIPILFSVYLASIDSDLQPMVGQVLDNTPASEVLKPGDIIVKIDDKKTPYWTTLQKYISSNPDKDMVFEVKRGDKMMNIPITSKLSVLRDEMDIMKSSVGRIGITPNLAAPVIGLTRTLSPASAAGLQNFDEIIELNGEKIESYVQFEQKLAANTKDELKLRILRPVDLALPYGSMHVLQPHEITVAAKIRNTEELGVASANMFVSQVDQNSPASKAGIQVGDQILRCDGETVNLFFSFIDKLAQTWEKPHELTIRRGDQVFNTSIQLEKLTVTGEFQEERPVIYAGFYNRTRLVTPEFVTKSWGDRIAYAASTSVETTVMASTVLVLFIVRMVQGKVSTKALGGPIMIGHMAYKAGSDGINAFLRMLAIISINLGIINLFPIPLLDGGKLVILGVEAIKRGPLSMRTRQIIAYIGLAMVLLLMLLAFKNDFERMWNLFFS
ncbi:MAG: RIP metalloprotease RseP [Bradymonadales bacterium]|jgi:regulator of sigma E protease